MQPCAFNTRLVDAGLFIRADTGRIGRCTKFPEQLGQVKSNIVSVQVLQNVHSKVHIKASVDSGGKFLSQHSQLGRSVNI